MFSENLRKIRKELGLSLARFADMLEMSANTLTNYELNRREPSLTFFVQLSKKTNVNLNWLVSGKGSMFNSPEFEDAREEILKEVDEILVKYGVKNK